ncbi:MAG: hypothetical protein RIC56_21210 [Pseudomonadales bacterium]
MDRQLEASTTVIEAMARTEAILAGQLALQRPQESVALAEPPSARGLKRWLDTLPLRFGRSGDPAT